VPGRTSSSSKRDTDRSRHLQFQTSLYRPRPAAQTDESVAAPGAIVAWANVNPNGTLSGQRSIAGKARLALGQYEIVFKRASLSECTFDATLGGIGFISLRPDCREQREGGDPKSSRRADGLRLLPDGCLLARAPCWRLGRTSLLWKKEGAARAAPPIAPRSE
jgi:hypothetical protein